MAERKPETERRDEVVVGHGSILHQAYLEVMNVMPSKLVLVLAKDVNLHYII